MTVSKPAKCQYCDTVLSSRQGKYEHENSVHTKTRSYYCKLCKRRWVSRTSASRCHGKKARAKLAMQAQEAEAQAPYVFAGASGSDTAAAAGGTSTNPGGPIDAPLVQQKYRWAPLYKPNPPEPEATDTSETLIHPKDYWSTNFS